MSSGIIFKILSLQHRETKLHNSKTRSINNKVLNKSLNIRQSHMKWVPMIHNVNYMAYHTTVNHGLPYQKHSNLLFFPNNETYASDFKEIEKKCFMRKCFYSMKIIKNHEIPKYY